MIKVSNLEKVECTSINSLNLRAKQIPVITRQDCF